MIIGYELWGPDNGSEMFSDMDVLIEPHKCGSCCFQTNYRQTNNLFKIKRKTFELSYTYDGISIASLKFKEFCIRNKYNNVIFKELEKSSGFFHMIIENSHIPFSARLLENYCYECGQYWSVIGPLVNIDDIEGPLKDGFYQSNLCFGGRSSRPYQPRPLSPIIIVAPSTMEKLKSEKFKNLTFEPIKK